MEYTFEINVKWVQSVPVESISNESYNEAVEKLKDTFEAEFGFRPEEHEIKQLSKEEV